MSLSDLLGRGYFPKELPPPFSTTSFAAAVAAAGAGLPAQLNPNLRVARPVVPPTKPVRYSHPRGGLLRRELGIPNPETQLILCRELDNEWANLAVGGTVLSATAPVLAAFGRAVHPRSPLDSRQRLAVASRVNRRHVLQTDISRFYHSIYTHSIPWALHTKAVAKRNRGHGLLGNRLDFLLRASNDGQTVGIPIGPDTSLVVSEIVMQACDRSLLAELPTLQGYRYIDDYELAFSTRTEAEDAFHVLERHLREFELALNPLKTSVLELPMPTQAGWITPLVDRQFRATPRMQERDLYAFFDLAAGLQSEYPMDGVLQFAVARLRWLRVYPANWELFQRLMIDCAAPAPASLPFVLELIISRVNAGAPNVIPEFGQLVNAIIRQHAPREHTGEVAWGLWACLALRIQLSPEAAAAVDHCDDSVVALLALHCEAAGLVPAGALTKQLWLRHMTAAGLRDDHWLLAYEANVQGWLPSLGGGDHVTADPSFAFLKASGVSFYDRLRANRPIGFPIPLPPMPPPPPPGGAQFSP